MTASPRGDGYEAPVGKVDVPKTGYDTGKRPVRDWFGDASPGCAATDLHEIHLARQSSLQVPVGHITVPGGIILCSPGTFLVATYLIINKGSCQVNFTKPNSATIRYTNSQWFSGATTEVPMDKGRRAEERL